MATHLLTISPIINSKFLATGLALYMFTSTVSNCASANQCMYFMYLAVNMKVGHSVSPYLRSWTLLVYALLIEPHMIND